MMIHYIGGAARSGKGILVRRLLTDLRLPYLSLDVLKMGLTRGLPELAFDPDAGLLSIIHREIAFSQYLQAECVRFHFPYFDLSHQFMPVLDQVVDYIRSGEHA